MVVCRASVRELTLTVLSLKIKDVSNNLLATVDGTSEIPVDVFIATNQEFIVELWGEPKISIIALRFKQVLPTGITYVSSTTSGSSGNNLCGATPASVSGSVLSWFSGGKNALSTTVPTLLGSVTYRYTGTSPTDFFWGPGEYPLVSNTDGIVWINSCNSGGGAENPHCNAAGNARWKIGIRFVAPGITNSSNSLTLSSCFNSFRYDRQHWPDGKGL